MLKHGENLVKPYILCRITFAKSTVIDAVHTLSAERFGLLEIFNCAILHLSAHKHASLFPGGAYPEGKCKLMAGASLLGITR